MSLPEAQLHPALLQLQAFAYSYMAPLSSPLSFSLLTRTLLLSLTRLSLSLCPAVNLSPILFPHLFLFKFATIYLRRSTPQSTYLWWSKAARLSLLKWYPCSNGINVQCQQHKQDPRLRFVSALNKYREICFY